MKKYNYYLNLRYEGFLLDHQSNNEPIIRQNDEGNIIFKNHYGFNVNTTTTVIFNWKNIIYTEKKGFLQNDAKYGCEYLETYEQIPFGYLKIIQLFNKTLILSRWNLQIIMNIILNISEKEYLN